MACATPHSALRNDTTTGSVYGASSMLSLPPAVPACPVRLRQHERPGFPRARGSASSSLSFFSMLTDRLAATATVTRRAVTRALSRRSPFLSLIPAAQSHLYKLRFSTSIMAHDERERKPDTTHLPFHSKGNNNASAAPKTLPPVCAQPFVPARKALIQPSLLSAHSQGPTCELTLITLAHLSPSVAAEIYFAHVTSLTDSCSLAVRRPSLSPSSCEVSS